MRQSPLPRFEVCSLVLLLQALALALGYSEFASQRGGIHCNLLVLDEVLQVRVSLILENLL